MTSDRVPPGEFEPDPRFTLANERTFLAWVRTSLALLAAGVAVDSLDLGWPRELRSLVATVLVLLAAGGAVHARLSWSRTERALRTHSALPRSRAPLSLVVGIVAMAVAVLVGQLL